MWRHGWNWMVETMTLLNELAQMMDASGRPFEIVVESILHEGDTALVFKNADMTEHICQIRMTITDDFAVKAGDREFVFVDATDVIMWIVQNL